MATVSHRDKTLLLLLLMMMMGIVTHLRRKQAANVSETHKKKKNLPRGRKVYGGLCCEQGHRAPHSVNQSCPTRPEPLPSELGLNFLPAAASRSPRIHHRAEPQQENTFVYRPVLRLSVASIQGGN